MQKVESNIHKEQNDSAHHSVIVERPPTLETCGRVRKRGPRSLEAVTRRNSNTENPFGLQVPQGGGLCESKPAPPYKDSSFTLLCMNIRGFLSHHVELSAHLEFIGMPSFVGLTETWLTNVVGSISLPGYTLVSRRDRNDGRQGGGIVLFARDSFVAQIVHIEDSTEYERSWHILHTDFGALCVGLWYRPPAHGEVGSIHSLASEHGKYSSDCVGTLVMDDMNVHYKPWLK